MPSTRRWGRPAWAVVALATLGAVGCSAEVPPGTAASDVPTFRATSGTVQACEVEPDGPRAPTMVRAANDLSRPNLWAHVRNDSAVPCSLDAATFLREVGTNQPVDGGGLAGDVTYSLDLSRLAQGAPGFDEVTLPPDSWTGVVGNYDRNAQEFTHSGLSAPVTLETCDLAQFPQDLGEAGSEDPTATGARLQLDNTTGDACQTTVAQLIELMAPLTAGMPEGATVFDERGTDVGSRALYSTPRGSLVVRATWPLSPDADSSYILTRYDAYSTIER